MSPPQRPKVTVHYAQTLDGRIATRTGDSQWIGGEASLQFAHQLRSQHHAVLVGVGTVLADNPRLTVRLVKGSSPVRVVVDSSLRLPLDCHLMADRAARTIIGTTAQAPRQRILSVLRHGAELLLVGQDAEGRVDLGELLARLGEQGIASVLIEGGRGVITSALRCGLVDRMTVCISPKLVGAGIDAVGDLGILRLGEAVTFLESRFIPLGEDMIFDGHITRRFLFLDGAYPVRTQAAP